MLEDTRDPIDVSRRVAGIGPYLCLFLTYAQVEREIWEFLGQRGTRTIFEPGPDG